MLNIRPIDPRDATLEFWDPAFRVRFWRPRGGSAVFAVVALDGELALVRLVGDDPTRAGP